MGLGLGTMLGAKRNVFFAKRLKEHFAAHFRVNQSVYYINLYSPKIR